MPYALIRAAGLKPTLSRLLVLQSFQKSGARHLSADHVYEALTREGVNVGRTTVYRLLTQFEQAGILIRHHFNSERSVFELRTAHHHDHLVCRQCGHVEEFYEDGIRQRQAAIAEARGYAMRDYLLHLYADCAQADCPRRK